MQGWILEHMIDLVFALITTGMLAGLKVLGERMKKLRTENDALRSGMEALLRDRIIYAYNKYAAAGTMPIYAMENVERMYAAYHGLGGNGTITGLVEAMREIPKGER